MTSRPSIGGLEVASERWGPDRRGRCRPPPRRRVGGHRTQAAGRCRRDGDDGSVLAWPSDSSSGRRVCGLARRDARRASSRARSAITRQCVTAFVPKSTTRPAETTRQAIARAGKLTPRTTGRPPVHTKRERVQEAVRWAVVCLPEEERPRTLEDRRAGGRKSLVGAGHGAATVELTIEAEELATAVPFKSREADACTSSRAKRSSQRGSSADLARTSEEGTQKVPIQDKSTRWLCTAYGQVIDAGHSSVRVS